VRPDFADRIPPPPPDVVEWMEQFGGEEATVVEGALRALEATLDRPGRNREGAYALLAADGLLTYAVEDAARAEDPETTLREILARVSEAV